jgi:glycosyltransferase involved in cell wall biosynthesis
MKIAVYLDDLHPTAGGGFTFQDDILRALVMADPREHSFVVFSNLSRRAATGLQRPHVRFRAARSKRWVKLQNYLATAFEPAVLIANSLRLHGWFHRALIREEIELVWFATPAFLRTDVPSIYTVWDLQHRVQPWFPEVSEHGRWLFREKLYRQILSRAAAVITPNRAGGNELSRYFQVPDERLLILPHPTPDFALGAKDVPDGAVLQRLGLRDPYLLYPAQVWPHKNHVGILHALRWLKEQGNPITVAFVGSDWGNRAFVQSIATELGLGEHTRFLGFVSRPDLIALYRNAQALVYLTYFGPENLPPLEAFALGCPVIASDVPGAREQLSDAALLVHPGDDQAVAEAIVRLLRDPALKAGLVERGRQRAQQWTAREYVNGVLDFCDRFAAVRRCWPA